MGLEGKERAGWEGKGGCKGLVSVVLHLVSSVMLRAPFRGGRLRGFPLWMTQRTASHTPLRKRGSLEVAYIIAVLSGLLFGASIFSMLSFRGVLNVWNELPTAAETLPQTVVVSTPGVTGAKPPEQSAAQNPTLMRTDERVYQAQTLVTPQVETPTGTKTITDVDPVAEGSHNVVVPAAKVSSSSGSSRSSSGSGSGSTSTRDPKRGPFRIIVLSMNRHWALSRLLSSIAAVDYGQDRVQLDIFVDMQRSTSRHDEKTVKVAREFEWPYGDKRVILHPRPMGLILAWLTCWNATSDDERAVMLEDDLEVSPLYYRFLREADDRYQNVEDLAAFSLQRATLIPRDEGYRKIQHGDNHQHSAYLYKLVGTWGFAPRAKHWTRFQQWFFERFPDKSFKPHVDRLRINRWYNGREWSNWFLRFCEEENLFNLYGNMPNKTTLCANWREPGEHYGKGPAKGREFPIFGADPRDYDFRLPEPRYLLRLDWNGQLHPAFHSEFHRVNMAAIDSLVDFAQGSDFLTLGLYNGYFSRWVRNFLCNVELLDAKPERLMFVTNDGKAHAKMVKSGVASTLMKFQGAESTRGTTFSTPGYIEFMLNRARLVMTLLQRGVATLLFDPDQTWLEDPIPYLREKIREGPVDLIGSVTTQEELGGNFLLFLPTECTITMYSDLLKRFESVFEAKDIGNANRTAQKVSLSNDQTLITSYALRQRRCHLALLDRQLFCDGRWYKGAYSDVDPSVRPIIINNNFVEGNDEKVHRASGFGHMFYNNRTDRCEPPKRLRAYYKKRSLYYTWQQVLNKTHPSKLIQH